MEDFNDGINAKLVFRMRKVNPEQFHTLVKMHLSFELDINTEDTDCSNEKSRFKKWSFLNFTKRPKSTLSLQQRTTEGFDLTDDRVKQAKKLIDFLSNMENITQEGIFRRTGKLTRQQDLRGLLLGRRTPLNLEDGAFSVHDCASVLKGFLAELSEPLLTESHYPAHCQIAELCGSTANDLKLLRSLQLLLLLLPYANRVLLKRVLGLLNKTAAHERENKMNCDTLATLFTPHLLCPRKLTPEALHANSQNLSCLIAFMIKKGIELFDIPEKLAMDVRAYWIEKERKLLSPGDKDLNESTTSDSTSTARTIFSFVDHKMSAQANSARDTQAALAQLYAHIQCMPDSAKKRRLVKQFNKENGQGTPRRHVKNCKAKSLGDSIKKHIFSRKIVKPKRSNSEENLGTTNFERSSSERFSKSDDELAKDVLDSEIVEFKVETLNSECDSRLIRRVSEPPNMYSTRNCTARNRKIVRRNSEPGTTYESPVFLSNDRFTSTPSDVAYQKLTTDDRSMSPISRSATKMTKAMQETMMTPRSRKPVMIVSGSNICNLATMNTSSLRTPGVDRPCHLSYILEEYDRRSLDEPGSLHSKSITSTFKEYLLSRSVLTASPVDLSFTSRTGDYEPSEPDINILNDDVLSDSLVFCLNGNNPESDTSGVGTGSTNSESTPSPRKRAATSARDDDSKKSTRSGRKQISESTLNFKIKDRTHQDTSF